MTHWRAAAGATVLTTALAAVWTVIGSVVAHAQTAAPRCFAEPDLAARPGEQRPVKGDRRFDAPEAARALAPFAPVAPALRGAIRRVELPPGRKLVALTLDLCEQPGEVAGYDGAIFDLLRREGVKATLFIGGKWMRSHPQRTAQLMSDPLFEFANHGAGHRNLRLLSGRALAEEIEAPQRAYEAIRADLASDRCLAPHAARTPTRMGLFRFPYGACNAAALDAVAEHGLLAIQWDVSTGDPWPLQSARAIADSFKDVRPGSIVIAHANGRGYNTASGLPAGIARLKAEGYEFVTVSELLAAGRPVITPTCYSLKPGDTDRYDRIGAGAAGGRPALLARPAAPSTAAGAGLASEKLPWQ